MERSQPPESKRLLICCSFCLIIQSKAKSKTVGVARQQRHFLCGDKENEAKESLALRWACLARSISGGNLSGLNFKEATLPP
jgi:hypothetical protein